MSPTQAFFLRIGGVVGALAVVTGAFGAHGLESRLDADALAIWETAVRYHFYHAIPLVALCFAPAAVWERRSASVAAWLFLIGIGIFSGTLYALALTDIRWLGAITPFGGVAFIAAWIALAFAAAPAKP